MFDWVRQGCVEDQIIKILSFLFFNVCGFRKKLQYFDFVIFVCKYDILCLIEMKIDNIDVINILGFVVYMKNRFDIVKVKFGGIILVIRENLVKYIEVLIFECEYVFWFKLFRNLFNSFLDILFGIIYVFFENIRYLFSDCFIDIE